MSKNKLNIVDRLVLEAKLLNGSEANLSSKQSEFMLVKFKDNTRQANDKVTELKNLSETVEQRNHELQRLIPTTKDNLLKTKEEYAHTSDSQRKRRLAQKLVVQHGYMRYLEDSNSALNATVQRIKDAVEDAQMVYDMSQQRARDAEIYYKLNGGLKLVGQALVAAKTQQKLPEIEYASLSTTMTYVEEEITNTDSDQLLAEADKIMKSLKAGK
jgi:hypothetical protein